MGVPGDDPEDISNGGSFHVIYGSYFGLTGDGDQLIDQDTPGIQNGVETDDYYAETLAMGDFDCDGYADVAVGIPREDLNLGQDPGAINIIYGSSTGLSTVDDWYHENTSGVDGTAAAYDYFAGALASGNFNGDSDSGFACSDIAIGVPGKDWSTYSNAGLIHIFYGSTSGITLTGQGYFSKDMSAVYGYARANAEFGSRFQVQDYDDDGYDDLWVRTADGIYCYEGKGYHYFPGSSTGASTSGDTFYCQENLTGMPTALSDYEDCVDATGICSCDVTLEKDLGATDIYTELIDVYACTAKTLDAVDRCITLDDSTDGQSDEDVLTCFEVSGDAWTGPFAAACLGSEMEAG